jgi:hypothetical protein
LLALAPLLAAIERPLLPLEDLELRDAIEVSLGLVKQAARGVAWPQP